MSDQVNLDNETVYDVLRSFHWNKNVEDGFTENDWADFVNELQDFFGDDQ